MAIGFTSITQPGIDLRAVYNKNARVTFSLFPKLELVVLANIATAYAAAISYIYDASVVMSTIYDTNVIAYVDDTSVNSLLEGAGVL